MNIRQQIISGGVPLLPVIFLVLLTVLSSCKDWIYDDLPECRSAQRLQLRFTKNILNTDAFGSQINHINVAVYDQSGKMILLRQEDRQLTEENNFNPEFELNDGVYDIVAWCEGIPVSDNYSSFQIEANRLGDDFSAAGATLPLSQSSIGEISDKDIRPLYYGRLNDVKVKYSTTITDLPILYLTKDTNLLTVILQNMDGNPIDPDLFEFRLEGCNSRLNVMNIPLANPEFTYLPRHLSPIYASLDQEVTGDADSQDVNRRMATLSAEETLPSGVKAEFTTSRIMADQEQYLTVNRKDNGENIFRIPLVEYLMMIRDYYQADSAQDYLDRNDRFTMAFFIKDDYSWMRARVLINGWRVVPPQNGVLQ